MARPVDSLSLERRVDSLFAKYDRPGSPGAVVGVMRGEHVELVKSYGLASIEHGVPITGRTRFRIASVSKQFTVTAALMLAAEGKLKLGDAPHKYIPELAPLPVTIDQMMRNSSGLPDFLELMRLGGHGLDRPARAADLFTACVLNRHLNFRPGSRFLYSNTNFLLLGAIVERVSRMKLGDFLAERIFKPLGMSHTALAPEIATIIPDLATGYLGDAETGFRRASHAYPQGGEGGLTSSVEDLLIWSRHFDRPSLEPNDLPAQLVAPHPLADGHANHYRRGLAVGPLRGLQTVGHGGLWPGYRTEFLRIPGVDLTVVVIANLATINPWRLARAVAALSRGTLAFQPQSEIGVEYARKITNEECRIDWSRPALEVLHHIHGLSPFPGAFTFFDFGKGPERLKILRVKRVVGQGTLGHVLDDAMTIACGSGALQILELQRAGSKPMAASEFLRGVQMPQGKALG